MHGLCLLMLMRERAWESAVGCGLWGSKELRDGREGWCGDTGQLCQVIPQGLCHLGRGGPGAEGVGLSHAQQAVELMRVVLPGGGVQAVTVGDEIDPLRGVLLQ